MDKEFRSERAAVQYQDPKATMNNGFVENLDINQGMIGDDIKDRTGKVQEGDVKANSEHQNNELSVYERLLKEIRIIQFDPAKSENIGMNDIEENKTINTSMNAVMDVLGDDNFSQKMKNDSSSGLKFKMKE